jgi:site-specific DNA recombinase
MNSAIIYVRVSTTEQADFGYSLTTQKQICTEYAIRNGYEVLKVFTEKGESAKTVNRTELQNMLSFIKSNKNKINALIIYKIDRLSRDLYDSLTIRMLLKKIGIKLVSVTEPFNDDTSFGILSANFFSMFAQFDNDVRSERTLIGMAEAVKQGRWLWNAPLGYCFEYRNQKSYLIPDDKADIVRKIFNSFVSGKKQYEIIEELKSEDINLTRQHLNNILRNYLYIGKIKTKLVDEIITGLHIPLIDEPIFYKAQDLLNPKRSTYGFTYTDEFPLKKFLKCPKCDRNLAGSYSKGRHKKYPYYHCTAKGCNYKPIRTDYAEYLFVQYLKSFQLTKDAIDKIFDSLKAQLESKQQDNKNIITNIKRDITSLEAKRKKNEEFLFDETIDRDTYKRKRDEIEEEIITKKVLLSDYENGLVNIEEIIEFGKRFIYNLPSLWLNLDITEKRGFQETMFPEGLSIENGEFRTATISPILSLIKEQKEAILIGQATLAGEKGFEPVILF